MRINSKPVSQAKVAEPGNKLTWIITPDPKEQKKGYATTLLRHIEEEAKAKGFSALDVEGVAAEDTEIRSWLEKRDYEVNLKGSIFPKDLVYTKPV
jgi:hypothetical protein